MSAQNNKFEQARAARLAQTSGLTLQAFAHYVAITLGEEAAQKLANCMCETADEMETLRMQAAAVMLQAEINEL